MGKNFVAEHHQMSVMSSFLHLFLKAFLNTPLSTIKVDAVQIINRSMKAEGRRPGRDERERGGGSWSQQSCVCGLSVRSL